MKRILIVDDEKSMRRIYAALLESEGFGVTGASNAVDAHEILKQGGVDLVLLDIRMPEVNGDDMYEIIRLFHKDIKVIVLSVYPVDTQKQLIEGAADYHDKSQGVAKLLEKINRVLACGIKVA